jgi:hypothetical protein
MKRRNEPSRVVAGIKVKGHVAMGQVIHPASYRREVLKPPLQGAFIGLRSVAEVKKGLLWNPHLGRDHIFV